MNKSEKDFVPTVATLTISDSDDMESVEWDKKQKQNIIAINGADENGKASENLKSATPQKVKTMSAAVIVDVIKTELKILNIFSGIEANEKEIRILHEEDDNADNYSGHKFRAPEKREYKKLLWTDSLWPCGGLTFYFDIISQARPNDTGKVTDGFYVPEIKFIPVTKWAIPGCKLTADMIVYDPDWTTGSDGLRRAVVTFDIDVHLIKLAVFNWKSRIRFSLSSDSTELKLLNDPLPSPF